MKWDILQVLSFKNVEWLREMMANQQQQLSNNSPARKDYDMSRHFIESFRLRRTYIVLLAIFFLLFIIEILFRTLVLKDRADFSLIFLLVLDLILAVLLAWVTAVPLAIYAYLWAVRKEQKQQSRLYTPLTAVRDVYETSDDEEEHRDRQQNILRLIGKVGTPLLILGLPGAGKTTALRAYQYPALDHSWSLLRERGKIPLYIPMKDYNVFLEKANVAFLSGNGIQLQQLIPQPYPPSLLDYLSYGSELTGVKYLRPYLEWLARRGRLMFLCDGLNEVSSNRLDFVCTELMRTMKANQNGVVMTCRELDYRERPALHQLVGPDYAEEVLILPLRSEQIAEFVERFVAHADVPHHRYSATEINTAITKHGRLGYNCTNPMMLVALIQTIDEVGIEDSEVQIGTRGRLLRIFVSRLVARELKREKPTQSMQPLNEQDILFFLGQIACTARLLTFRNSIPLGNGNIASGGVQRNIPARELAERVRLWLDEHDQEEWDANRQPVQRVPVRQPYTPKEIERLLQFAQNVPLISISYNGVLSFYHELVAEYFVAEYLSSMDTSPPGVLPFGPELVTNIGAWSEPVTIWTGLSTDPMTLARRFAHLGQQMGQSNQDYAYNALSLSLACAGVYWSSQMAPQRGHLPDDVTGLLLATVSDTDNRDKLAAILDKCAKEGAVEIYRSLLPLIMETDIDDLLLRLDKRAVPGLLFDYLSDAVDNQMPADTVDRLVMILGRFGADIVERAVQLSAASSKNSVDFRVQVISVLGGTSTMKAVDPLIRHLEDLDDGIIEAAAHALVQLGPNLGLDRLLEELRQHTPEVLIERMHYAVLFVLHEWLVKNRLTPLQHQRTIEALLSTLTSIYKPQVRQEAIRLLKQQTDKANARHPDYWKRVVQLLIRALADRDDVKIDHVMDLLRQLGAEATLLLIAELETSRQEIVQARIVQVVGTVRDPDALPHLLPLLDNAPPLVLEQVALALRNYAPESIDKLINVVIYHQNMLAARRATDILKAIGESCLQPVVQKLEPIVRDRTLLLVEVLVHIRHTSVIRPLISLLKRLQKEMDRDLGVAVIWALHTFPERQVVLPLLDVLVGWGAPFYEEAAKVLSSFGALALNDLVAALDVEEETVATQRVRATLLQMQPFLFLPLLTVFQFCSERQGGQIEKVFLQKGDRETAEFLVSQLSHQQPRVREAVLHILDGMGEEVVVDPLLSVLGNPRESDAIFRLLRKYQGSVPRLAAVLSDPPRSEAAYMILLDFGVAVIPHLVPALNHPNFLARKRVQDILISLVRREQEPQAQRSVLEQVVGLFEHLSPGSLGRESVLDILTNQFTAQSLPVLLDNLADVRLKDGCVAALVRLVHSHNAYKDQVLEALVDALHVRERRDGAGAALIGLDADAVDCVSSLVTDNKPEVALKAQSILSEIGAAALPFVWGKYRDASNPRLQTAARKIFSDMPTHKIKDKLIEWLTGNDPLDVEMALTLLVERMLLEEQKPAQEMIPALLEYVRQQGQESVNLRIIALLLLQRKEVVIKHLVNVLYTDHQEWLPQIFLLLGLNGDEAQRALQEVLENSDKKASSQLRAETAAIMGLMRMDMQPYATALSRYSALAPDRATVQFSQLEQLEISLRALGGLLASGKWGVSELQGLRRNSKEGTPEHDLYSILLGRHFSGEFSRLEWEIDRLNEQLSNAEKVHHKNNDEHNRERMRWQQQMDKLQQDKIAVELERNRLKQEIQRLGQQQPPAPSF